jgi:predicted house-cleaning noncanonical NTP pyrophosphatase (MazG superfamily)
MKKNYKFECNKLVRDGTIERSEKLDYKMDYIFLDGNSYLDALREKLIEEVNEIYDAKTKDEIRSEIADLLECIYAFAKKNGLTHEEIQKERVARKKLRGGFEKGVYCKTFTAEEGSPMFKYFCENEKKYPRKLIN